MGRAASLIFVLALLVAGCLERAQAIVIIDADMPIPADISADPTLSLATSFDRVEVEVLASDGTGSGTSGDGKQLFVVGPSSPWPITFGVRDGFARLRIRAYRAAHASRGASGLGEPSPRVVIERLAFADVPNSGRTTLRVVLHGECLGLPADARAGTTCIDDPRTAMPATAAIEQLGENASPPPRPPLWSRAQGTPCSATAPDGAACVPGGTFLRGDAATADLDPASGYLPTPLLLVTLSPFFMDTTEVTVSRYRALRAKGAVDRVAEPRKGGFCTWTELEGTTARLPLTCVSFETAREVCRAGGGDLPTEAQWEYAARRRNGSSAYPWGDTDPTCCVARIADSVGCNRGRPGTSVVGSYGDAAKCDGIADASVDGIFDLAGNVRERVLDGATRYDGPDCAPLGIPTDPVCASTPSSSNVARGGSFRSTFDEALSSLRTRDDLRTDDLGFRCVYPGASR